ncbi:MAG: hypothetical protein AAFY56_13325, partial [Pseudomonadota bacterium]
STEITIPAIEAMRYSPLRREIVALIASTMDRQNADLCAWRANLMCWYLPSFQDFFDRADRVSLNRV